MSNRPPFFTMTADEILNAKYPEPRWAVPNILPVGLTILAGAPKVGKSWLALQIAHAVAAGGEVLGEQVVQGPVLVLALEDPARRLRDRMSRQGWSPGMPVDFVTIGLFEKQIGELTKGGGEKLARSIEQMGYRLVVIDTYSRAIRGDQMYPDVVTRELTPLQEMAHAKDCGVLMTDHHHKSASGESADSIGDLLGSTAKGAMADTIWGLYRQRGKRGAILEVTGRDIEDRSLKLAFDKESCIWTLSSDQGQGTLSEKRQEIVKAVKELGESTCAKIAETIVDDKGNVHGMLQDLVEDGVLQKQGKRYSVPTVAEPVQPVQPIQPADR